MNSSADHSLHLTADKTLADGPVGTPHGDVAGFGLGIAHASHLVSHRKDFA